MSATDDGNWAAGTQEHRSEGMNEVGAINWHPTIQFITEHGSWTSEEIERRIDAKPFEPEVKRTKGGVIVTDRRRFREEL